VRKKPLAERLHKAPHIPVATEEERDFHLWLVSFAAGFHRDAVLFTPVGHDLDQRVPRHVVNTKFGRHSLADPIHVLGLA
jgi:hypothetical protein